MMSPVGKLIVYISFHPVFWLLSTRSYLFERVLCYVGDYQAAHHPVEIWGKQGCRRAATRPQTYSTGLLLAGVRGYVGAVYGRTCPPQFLAARSPALFFPYIVPVFCELARARALAWVSELAAQSSLVPSLLTASRAL
jgi:hypothetical protein